MFVHDVIKIIYINMGYLPGYPFYLISDAEMFEAFLKEDGFFNEFYPCPDESMQVEYDNLRAGIVQHVSSYLIDGTEIPDWVYSYMIMSTITYQSPEEDIAYLFDMSSVDPESPVAEFNKDIAEECLDISRKWILKQPSKYRDRPPTMFGEPHVVKSLRLEQANILSN